MFAYLQVNNNKRGCLKSIKTRHSELVSESHRIDSQSLSEPETSSG
jgi:hypothetical protein